MYHMMKVQPSLCKLGWSNLPRVCKTLHINIFCMYIYYIYVNNPSDLEEDTTCVPHALLSHIDIKLPTKYSLILI